MTWLHIRHSSKAINTFSLQRIVSRPCATASNNTLCACSYHKAVAGMGTIPDLLVTINDYSAAVEPRVRILGRRKREDTQA